MKFLRTHATASGVGAAFGAAFGLVTLLEPSGWETPELLLRDWLPIFFEKLAQLMGFSDLHDMFPWWARDTPAYMMLPVTAIFVWLLTLPCRPQANEVAAVTFAMEGQQMLEDRRKVYDDTVRLAELKTPSGKQFSVMDRETAERKAQQTLVTQQAADLLAAQSAHAEYAAMLEESLVEWRLLRFEVVACYVLGWVITYLVGPMGLLAVPLLAPGVPITIFVVLVVANVVTQWTVYCFQRCGCCLPQMPSGAAAWSLEMRETRAGEMLSGCAASLAACLSCCKPTQTVDEFWGVRMRSADESAEHAKKWMV